MFFSLASPVRLVYPVPIFLFLLLLLLLLVFALIAIVAIVIDTVVPVSGKVVAVVVAGSTVVGGGVQRRTVSRDTVRRRNIPNRCNIPGPPNLHKPGEKEPHILPSAS